MGDGLRRQDVLGDYPREGGRAGEGKRESIYQFYETASHGSPAANRQAYLRLLIKTSSARAAAWGVTDTGRHLAQYILDAVHEQYYAENGKSISLYPVEMLADRFLNTRDFELYRKELAAFLRPYVSSTRKSRKTWTRSSMGCAKAPRRNAAIAAIACGGFTTNTST